MSELLNVWLRKWLKEWLFEWMNFSGFVSWFSRKTTVLRRLRFLSYIRRILNLFLLTDKIMVLFYYSIIGKYKNPISILQIRENFFDFLLKILRCLQNVHTIMLIVNYLCCNVVWWVKWDSGKWALLPVFLPWYSLPNASQLSSITKDRVLQPVASLHRY